MGYRLHLSREALIFGAGLVPDHTYPPFITMFYFFLTEVVMTAEPCMPL